MGLMMVLPMGIITMNSGNGMMSDTGSIETEKVKEWW